MLTFEEKQAIIESFPELTKKEVSMKRLNYHYENSLYDKTVVVQHLHPNGNGFVYVGDLAGYDADQKGLVNIREASESDLRKIISDSIRYLSEEDAAAIVLEEQPIEQQWRNREGEMLILIHEDMLWNVYIGLNLEESFESQKEAENYLLGEGFRPFNR